MEKTYRLLDIGEEVLVGDEWDAGAVWLVVTKKALACCQYPHLVRDINSNQSWPYGMYRREIKISNTKPDLLLELPF